MVRMALSLLCILFLVSSIHLTFFEEDQCEKQDVEEFWRENDFDVVNPMDLVNKGFLELPEKSTVGSSPFTTETTVSAPKQERKRVPGLLPMSAPSPATTPERSPFDALSINPMQNE